MATRKTEQDYHNLAAKRGFQWVGQEVPPTVKTKTLWDCGNGHQFEADFDHITQGTGCKYCAGLVPKNEEDYRELAARRGIEWIGDIPPNTTKTKTCWRCANGHEWEAVYQSIEYQGTGCPVCHLNKRRQNQAKNGSKWCGGCQDFRPISEFYKRSDAYDGLRTQCRKCEGESTRQWREENSEQVKQTARNYRIINYVEIQRRRKLFRTVHREEISKYYKEYYRKNPDYHHQRGMAYRNSHRSELRAKDRERYHRNIVQQRIRIRVSYRKNREKRLAYAKDYIKTPTGKLSSQAARQRRAAKIRDLPNTLTLQQWQQALEYFHGCCAVCSRQLNDLFNTHTAAMDHWIPLSSPQCPGTVATNIIPLCHGIGGCNNSKRDKDAISWLQETYGDKEAKRILERIRTYFEWVRQQN